MNSCKPHGFDSGSEINIGLDGSLDSVLRDYDRAGRFGGEEFSLLLPQTRAVDAFRIAGGILLLLIGIRTVAHDAANKEH